MIAAMARITVMMRMMMMMTTIILIWRPQLILFAEYLDANKPPGPKMLELEQLPYTETIAASENLS
jgi:hypothetical protein